MPASAHGGLPSGILLGDADGVEHVGTADGRLALGDARHRHLPAGEIDGGIETTVGIVDGIVVAEETQLAPWAFPRREGLQRGFRGFDQRN